MARLPALDDDRLFSTDGGFETSLIFHQGLDLPCFAAFDLLKDEPGREAIRAYFAPYLEIARDRGIGFVADTATWRANPDWARQVGYDSEALDAANREAVKLAEELRAEGERNGTPVVVNGVLGPRGDGYAADTHMTPEEAERYHSEQIATFADTTADLVSAITMTYPDEALGIVRAARAADLPVTISFTVETDGRLPNGGALAEAIEQVDRETDGAPLYFMINCAHPTHFEAVVRDGGAWRERIGGVRPNASTKSHAELDEAEELDEGDPADLGARCAELRDGLSNIRVLGGCCGTDHRHVGEVCAAWAS